MIQTTLGDLVRAEKALERVGERKLPTREGYRAAKLVRAVQRELKIYADLNNKIVRRLGSEQDDKDAEGKSIKVFRVPPDKMADYIAELSDVQDQPVEINAMPLDLDSLGSDPFTIEDLAALGALVVLNDEQRHENANAAPNTDSPRD